MATKKMSPEEMTEYIHSLRGKYKHLPLMETLKEMKREEKELEERKYQRLAAFGKKDR